MDDQPDVLENAFLWVAAGMFLLTAIIWIVMQFLGIWWESMKSLVRWDDAKYRKK